MSGFKPKFIGQFIIDALVLGILLGILSRIVTAVAIKVFSLEGTAVCYAIELIGGIFNALAIAGAVFLTQNTLAKKGVGGIDDPTKFYIVFSGIMIAINAIFSVVGFSATYNTCAGNISMLAMQNELMDTGAFTSIKEASEKVQETIRNAVVASVVIQNILQAAIFGICIPLFKKRHEKLF